MTHWARRNLVGAWCPSVSGWGGTLLRDLSGNGLHLSLQNATATESHWDAGSVKSTSGSGAIASGIRFTSSLPNVFHNSEATFSIWVRRTLATPVTDDGAWKLDQMVISGATHYPWTDGVVYVSTFRSTRTSFTPSFTNRTVWHHVSIVSGGGQWTFYISGNVEQTNSHAFVAPNAISIISGNDTISNYRFGGEQDDVRLYNVALTQSQVRQLCDGGRGYGLRPERDRRYGFTVASSTRSYSLFRPSILKASR